MLINAQYLDSEALQGYVAAAEDGLRQSGTSHTKGDHGRSGSLGVGPIRVEGRSGSETESTLNLADHDSARLTRLIAAGRADSDKLGWVEVANPNTDFKDVGIGTFIDWECDVYMPEAIKALSQVGGTREALKMMESFLPLMDQLGFDRTDLPDQDTLGAMTRLFDNVDITPVLIGEDADTDWSIVGSLESKWIKNNASLDDRVRIVAKVKRTVQADRWYPLFALPGMKLIGRDERRRLEREGPQTQEDESNFVHGPLLVVDYLAVYN